MPQIQGETIGQQTEKTYKQAVTGNAVTALQLGSGKGKLSISQLAPSARHSVVVSDITWEELRDAVSTGREFVIAVPWGHATFHVHNDLLIEGHPDVHRLVAVVGDKILMYKCSSSDDGATVTWSDLIIKDIGEAPLDITYDVTPFENLKAAYDNGQSVRMRGSFGITITFAPMYNDGGDAGNVVMFGALMSNSVTGSDQYYILSVTKGEEGQPDVWVSHNEFIGTNDVKVLSVDSSSWTGARTYTLQAKDAGKVVDFGTIPATVRGLTIKVPSGVNSAYFKWTLSGFSDFSSLSVTDASDNELKIINKSKPSEFSAGDTIIASVMCGDVAYGVSKAAEAHALLMGGNPVVGDGEEGEEQANEGGV